MNNNHNLVYPKETDYYDINVFNNNFSRLADAIDSTTIDKREEIIVAAYNSTSPLKSSASFTCTQGDCSPIIAQAVNAAGNGGTVILLDGDFYVNTVCRINKSVHIKGLGKFYTRLNSNKASVLSILNLGEMYITVENIGFYTEPGSSNSYAIDVATTYAVIKDCYFNMKYLDVSDDAAAILIYCSGYTSIRNCIFEQADDSRFMVNSKDYVWKGNMYGCYAQVFSTYNQIPIKVNLMNAAGANEISFGAQNTKIYVKGTEYNS